MNRQVFKAMQWLPSRNWWVRYRFRHTTARQVYRGSGRERALLSFSGREPSNGGIARHFVDWQMSIYREQWSSGHHCCCSFGRSRVRSRRPATLGRFSVVSLPSPRWIPGWCHYKSATAAYLPPFLTLQFTYSSPHSSPSQNSLMTLAVEASINNKKEKWKIVFYVKILSYALFWGSMGKSV